jgi:hypothetical protein
MIDYLINTIIQLCILDVSMKCIQMTQKAVWICYECRKVFVFHRDVDDHKGLSGHKMIEKVMTISPAETMA